MIRVQMRELVTRKKNGLRIPGDWIAEVPEFRADEDYVTKLTGMMLPLFAHNQPKARALALERCDELGRSEYLRRLEWFVQRQAEAYARRWPQHVMADRTLRGFDPAKLQHVFLLGNNRVGRNGWPALRKAMQDMAKAA